MRERERDGPDGLLLGRLKVFFDNELYTDGPYAFI